MQCPVCESKNNKITDSRKWSTKVYRRRKCECGFTFTTYEIMSSSFFDLVDRLEDFSLEVKELIKELEVRE